MRAVPFTHAKSGGCVPLTMQALCCKVVWNWKYNSCEKEVGENTLTWHRTHIVLTLIYKEGCHMFCRSMKTSYCFMPMPICHASDIWHNPFWFDTLSMSASVSWDTLTLEVRNVAAMKQHDNQHAHGFGKDIKDCAIWAKLPTPQEGRRKGERKKESKQERKKLHQYGKNSPFYQSTIYNNHNRPPCVWWRLRKVISQQWE